MRKEWGCLEFQAGKLEAFPEETVRPRTHFSWQNVIAEHEIRNISCAAQDPEDLCTFAYITKDLQTSHHYCHVFSTVDVVSVPVTVATEGSTLARGYLVFYTGPLPPLGCLSTHCSQLLILLVAVHSGLSPCPITPSGK